MTPALTLNDLRTLTQFHSGQDLQARLAHTEDIVRRQREGLAILPPPPEMPWP